MDQEVKDYVLSADSPDQAAFRLTYIFNQRAQQQMTNDRNHFMAMTLACVGMMFVPGAQLLAIPVFVTGAGYLADRKRKENVSFKETFEAVCRDGGQELGAILYPMKETYQDVEDWGVKDLDTLKEFHLSWKGAGVTIGALLLMGPLAIPLVPLVVVQLKDFKTKLATIKKSEDIAYQLTEKNPDLSLH